jgi:hypothetical protein
LAASWSNFVLRARASKAQNAPAALASFRTRAPPAQLSSRGESVSREGKGARAARHAGIAPAAPCAASDASTWRSVANCGSDSAPDGRCSATLLVCSSTSVWFARTLNGMPSSCKATRTAELRR